MITKKGAAKVLIADVQIAQLATTPVVVTPPLFNRKGASKEIVMDGQIAQPVIAPLFNRKGAAKEIKTVVQVQMEPPAQTVEMQPTPSSQPITQSDPPQISQQPFVDINLEHNFLRYLIYNPETDSKEIKEEISGNLAYAFNLGIGNQVFNNDFRKWIYDTIIDNYVKFSECVSKIYIQSELEKKYKDQAPQKLAIFDKIFSYKFEFQFFKQLVSILRDKYNYRVLYEMNMSLNSKLRKDFVDGNRNSIDLARIVNETTNKILMSTGKITLEEGDAYQNIDEDIKILREKKENPFKFRGIPSGYEQIDSATGGWHGGEFILVMGRPGMGKSILLLNFGYNAYNLGYNAVYVTIEMPMSQQKQRFMSLATKTSYNKIKTPSMMADEEIDYLEKKLREEKLAHKNFFWLIDAPENCNTAFIESRIISFENTTKQKVHQIIIDPIYLMSPSDKKAEDKVGVISWDLKILARKLNIPVLGASQFNRESHKRHLHGKEVDTMDAAFTDKLGHNTDIMIGITGDKDLAELYFPKSRDSQISKLYFRKEFDIMRFVYDDRSEKENTEDNNENF